MQRFDQPHGRLDAPYVMSTAEKNLAEMICRRIENEEVGAREIGQQLVSFQPIQQHVLSLANQSLPVHRRRIDDPIHAAVMLGRGRLHKLFTGYLAQQKAAD